MLTYRPTFADGPDFLEGDITGDRYLHPSRALAEAQRLAAGEADASSPRPVALVLEHLDDQEFAAMCPTCYAPVGGLHLATCSRARDGVMVIEAVVRPAEQAITEPAR